VTSARSAVLSRANAVGVVAALVCSVLAACSGWRIGSGTALPAEATVGVQFLDNRTWVPDLEIEVTRILTDAVIDHVGRRPDHPSSADYVVRGAVIDYARRAGVRTRENQLLETGVTIGIEVELVRKSDGVVVSRASRAWNAGFAVDARGLATDAPAEREQRERLLRHLGEGLVLDLFRAPAYKGVE
jgi:hypothetical protein